MTRSHWSLALYAALIFAGGSAVGALGHRLYSSSPVIAKSVAPPTPDEWRKRFTAEMTDRVRLSPEQLTSLSSILDESRTLYQQVKEKYRPEMRAIHDAQVGRIKTMLRPEQLKEYEKILAEREARAKQNPRP